MNPHIFVFLVGVPFLCFVVYRFFSFLMSLEDTPEDKSHAGRRNTNSERTMRAGAYESPLDLLDEDRRQQELEKQASEARKLAGAIEREKKEEADFKKSCPILRASLKKILGVKPSAGINPKKVKVHLKKRYGDVISGTATSGGVGAAVEMDGLAFGSRPTEPINLYWLQPCRRNCSAYIWEPIESDAQFKILARKFQQKYGDDVSRWKSEIECGKCPGDPSTPDDIHGT